MAREAYVTQGPLTTEAGAPVADNQNSETAGVGGPVLVQDQLLLEKLAHFTSRAASSRTATPTATASASTPTTCR